MEWLLLQVLQVVRHHVHLHQRHPPWPPQEGGGGCGAAGEEHGGRGANQGRGREDVAAAGQQDQRDGPVPGRASQTQTQDHQVRQSRFVSTFLGSFLGSLGLTENLLFY